MSKILVIFTGGTIGSVQSGDKIDVMQYGSYEIIERYTKAYGEKTEFKTLQPLNILSENIGLSSWNTLCNALLSQPLSSYDGVIVTHGSDTLSYTAALLGMVLRHTPVPIVLVAANYTLADGRSNGLNNFKAAADFITQRIKGVFVSYANNRGDSLIYLATRLRESDPYRDEFSSFEGTAFGRMENGVFLHSPHASNVAIGELKQERKPLFHTLNLQKNVLLIRQYPAIDYRAFHIRNAGAVLLYLYHSATACTMGEGSVLSFIRRCKEEGTPVYAASFKRDSIRTPYQTAKAMLAAGIIPLMDISPESAYAKVCLIANAQPPLADTLLNQTVYFEYVKESKKR